MAGFVVGQPPQVFGGAPGVAFLGPNARVKGRGGFLGTSADTVLLAHGGTGRWVTPDTRTQIGGVFTVSQSSQGIAIIPGTPPVTTPMFVTSADPAIRSQ